MTCGSRLLVVALTFALLLGPARRVHADPPIQSRKMGIEASGAGLSLFYSARDLINLEAQKKLDSGLPQRIVVQHFAYARGRNEPIAISGHSCRIVYDLWQAVYRVEYELFGVGVSAFAYRTRAEVLERCLVMRGFPLGQAPEVAGVSRVYVASLIELNPLSNTTLARIRRWLARPRGDYNVEGKSFYGSFVSLFVNDRIGAAERVLKLRSQDVELPPWR
jgi:hypothetical protein